MSIFEDAVRRQFGFPTKKESLDKKIENYRIGDAIAINEAMAHRNIDISYLEEQIRQLEKVINDNQFFIDTYETIKSEAIKKVKMGICPIKARIIDSTGKEIIYANYATMESYLVSIEKSGNPSLLADYVKGMGAILEQMWQAYVFKIIQGKGFFSTNDTEFDEGLDIYQAYIKALNSMKAGFLKNENRESVTISSTNITFINTVNKFCYQVNKTLTMALDRLKISLEKIKNTQAEDEYSKRIITEMQTMMRSTREYFEAQKSEEFFNLIEKLK